PQLVCYCIVLLFTYIQRACRVHIPLHLLYKEYFIIFFLIIEIPWNPKRVQSQLVRNPIDSTVVITKQNLTAVIL
ncbi:unnamed protein product, partial [Larinioides sclopetarius]